MFRLLALICLTILLTGCGFFDSKFGKSDLVLSPIELEQVKWEKLEVNGKKYVALDETNFNLFQVNEERVQGQLWLSTNYIQSLKK